MLGYWADALGKYAARLRFPRRAVLRDAVVKINIGSGLHVAAGWTHVDGSLHALLAGAPRPLLALLYRSSNSVRATFTPTEYIQRLSRYRFIFADFERGLPFDDAVAHYVYSSHVLEHFYLADARRLLREIHRILKPGGRVRICVPDLAHAVALFQEGRSRDALAYFFSDARVGHYHQHRFLYDFALLAEELKASGFTDIAHCSYQHGAVPDLDRLDNRPEETLYVEATRPL